jgi:hypothetical protein
VTTGAGLTGLVFNSGSLTAYYHRPGSAAAAITLATLASATAAWATGGFIAVDGTNMPGLYRLDLPDAVLATGVDEVVVMLRARRTWKSSYSRFSSSRTTRTTACAWASRRCRTRQREAAGGLLTRGTGAGQINQDANGRIDVNLVAVGADTTSVTNLKAYTNGTTPAPVNVTQFGGTMAAFAGGRPEVNTTHFGGTAATSTGGIPTVNTIQWRGVQPNNLSSGRLDSTVGAMQADVVTAAAIAADAIGASELAADAATEIAAALGALVMRDERQPHVRSRSSRSRSRCGWRHGQRRQHVEGSERHLDARHRDDRRQQQPHGDGAQPERVVCGHPLLGPAVLGRQLLVQLLLGQPSQRCLRRLLVDSYWSNRYWQPHYWAGSAVPAQRGYWSSSYWSAATGRAILAAGLRSPFAGRVLGRGLLEPRTIGAPITSRFRCTWAMARCSGTMQSTLGGLGASVFGASSNPGLLPGQLSRQRCAQRDAIGHRLPRAAVRRIGLRRAELHHSQEFPGFDAQIDTTLGGVASVLSGTFLPVGSINGSPSRSRSPIWLHWRWNLGWTARAHRRDRLDARRGARSLDRRYTFLPGARIGAIDAILDDLAANLSARAPWRHAVVGRPSRSMISPCSSADFRFRRSESRHACCRYVRRPRGRDLRHTRTSATHRARISQHRARRRSLRPPASASDSRCHGEPGISMVARHEGSG